MILKLVLGFDLIVRSKYEGGGEAIRELVASAAGAKSNYIFRLGITCQWLRRCSNNALDERITYYRAIQLYRRGEMGEV